MIPKWAQNYHFLKKIKICSAVSVHGGKINLGFIFLLVSTVFYNGYPCGEVAERSNAAVLKTVEGATPPRVRIPASPPKFSLLVITNSLCLFLIRVV